MTQPLYSKESSLQPADSFDSLSVPTYRGSTLLYPSFYDFLKRGERGRKAFNYGLHGTPTTRALEARITELESGYESFLLPSGLMAITTTVLSLMGQGECVLFPDSVYPPVRRFVDTTLDKLGITATFYDPIRPDLLDFEREGVRLVWVESPGSTTMEVQDVPAIVKRAAAFGAVVACDNSWASPLMSKPLELGADIVVEAVTKYLSGHSDLLLGSITVADESTAATIHGGLKSLGVGVSPDDCFLALRGLETAEVRLSRIAESAIGLAEHIQCVAPSVEVLHPALPSFPTHAQWQQQFRGASGLFSFVLPEESQARTASRFEQLRLFKIGASWGGTQSLLAPTVLGAERTIDKSYCGKNDCARQCWP